eukprot:14451334-Ditylum_brightwellii.AAC.1
MPPVKQMNSVAPINRYDCCVNQLARYNPKGLVFADRNGQPLMDQDGDGDNIIIVPSPQYHPLYYDANDDSNDDDDSSYSPSDKYSIHDTDDAVITRAYNSKNEYQCD